MKQYLDLLNNILDNGVEKESGRENMPNTIGISNGIIKMNLQEGFPLLTTKKMYWKGIVHELLWILNGDTNIKYLVNNDVNIWNSDAYRWYLRYCDRFDIAEEERFSIEEFIETIKANHLDRFSKKSQGVDTAELGSVLFQYLLGDLGKIYGYQWRNQNYCVDQIKNIIDGLIDNPYSRYHILNAWNAADIKNMALPPCHLLYQFIVRPLSVDERRNILHYSGEFTDMLNDSTESMDAVGVPKFYLEPQYVST